MDKYVLAATLLPENKTLRHILSTKFPNGMPEKYIAMVLKSNMTALLHIKTHSSVACEPEINDTRIHFAWEIFEKYHDPRSIQLAYDPEFLVEGDDPERPQVGIWGAGIIALELAYGSLPENITPQQLVTMANNLKRILRQKLENEQKNIKKLPDTLQMLLDDGYVNRREQELIAEKNAKAIQRAKKVIKKIFRPSPTAETHQNRSFSRNFLEVVMICLDKEHPTPLNRILELPFLKKVK